MEIILQIAPQEATEFNKRLAVLEQCFQDGSLLLSERDGEKPAQFTLTLNDVFPWHDFFKKLRVSWWLSQQKVPNAFLPQKRIPEELLDEMEKLPERELLRALATLRAEKYFPTLPINPL